MTRHGIRLAGAFALVLAAAGARAQEPTGTWISETGETRIRIAKCGSSFCGTIVAAKGDPKDENNPNPALRSRPLVGVQMISNVQPSGDGWAGALYNPRDGKTYAGKMKLKGASALELSGCVAAILCRTQTWTKAN